jgi:hypothetical protein
MKVHFIWKNCNQSFNATSSWRPSDWAKTVFFISTTPEEAELVIRPLLDPSLLERYQDLMEDKDHPRKVFVVSRDLEIISPSFHAYPISGMWNGFNPWEYLFHEIQSLEDLATLDTTPQQKPEKLEDNEYWKTCFGGPPHEVH